MPTEEKPQNKTGPTNTAPDEHVEKAIDDEIDESRVPPMQPDPTSAATKIPPKGSLPADRT